MTNMVGVYRRWLEPPPPGLPKSQWPRKRRYCWVVRWFDTSGKRRGTNVQTKAEAERMRSEKMAEFDKVPTARRSAPRVTIGVFIDEFVKLRIGPRGERLRLTSLTECRSALARLADFIGRDTPLVEISSVEATRFVADLRESTWVRDPDRKLSPATANKILGGLRSSFNVAVERLHYLRVNPFVGLRQQKISLKSPRYVSPQEFLALQKAAATRYSDQPSKRLWWQVFNAVCYTAGTRLGEALNLTWADIDFENDNIRIVAKPETGVLHGWQPKDVDSRTVPIPQLTVDLLARMQENASEGNPYVLIPNDRLMTIKAAKEAGTWNEGQQLINNIKRDWGYLMRFAKFGKATRHDLRRSCITNWGRVLPMHVVQELAGHASIETTRKYYLAVTVQDMDAARRATEDAIKGVSIDV